MGLMDQSLPGQANLIGDHCSDPKRTPDLALPPAFIPATSCARKLEEELEYGMVGINNTGQISAEEAPIDCIMRSGVGRYGSHYGLKNLTKTKYMRFGEIA